MGFVIKGKYIPPHLCNTPPQTENNPLVPGDMWKCDDCGRHAVWAYYYGEQWEWYFVTERQARRILRRHLKGKPFKREHSHGTGPG